MNNLFLTLMIAFVVIVMGIACLAIGWLIKGKTNIDRCGRDPTKKRDESCSTASCDLCHHSEDKSDEKKNDQEDPKSGEDELPKK
jgi:hypothetical protein